MPNRQHALSQLFLMSTLSTRYQYPHFKDEETGSRKLSIKPKSQLVDSEGGSHRLSFITKVASRALLKMYIECINHQLIPLEVKKD